MKLTLMVLLMILLSLFAVSCRNESSEINTPVMSFTGNETGQMIKPQTATAHETMVDEQGSVSVAVTPINLNDAAESLDFEVTMNTHSVDLSMDLATLATITTDNGRSVTAMLWEATPGGHHVSGVLSFPAMAEEAFLLDDATRLTMTIRDVDAPERIFTWDVVN